MFGQRVRSKSRLRWWLVVTDRKLVYGGLQINASLSFFLICELLYRLSSYRVILDVYPNSAEHVNRSESTACQ